MSKKEINVTVVGRTKKGRRCYFMRYVDPKTGIRHERSAKTANENKARKLAGVWQEELDSGKGQPGKNLKWVELRDRYEQDIFPNLTHETRNNRDCILNRFEQLCQIRYASDLDSQTFADYKAALHKRGLAFLTRSTHMSVLRQVAIWAVDHGYLKKRPRFGMPRRKMGQKKGRIKLARSRPVTGEEVDRMIGFAPLVRTRDAEKWQALLKGLWASGLRLNEALALSWDQVDDVAVLRCQGKWSIRFYGEGQKSGADEIVPCTAEFQELLEGMPHREGRVFGLDLTTKAAVKIISKIGRRANVLVNAKTGKCATAHDLRRGFATKWSTKVMPVELADMMRDELATVMKFYVDRSTKDLGEAIARAESKLVPAEKR